MPYLTSREPPSRATQSSRHRLLTQSLRFKLSTLQTPYEVNATRNGHHIILSFGPAVRSVSIYEPRVYALLSRIFPLLTSVTLSTFRTHFTFTLRRLPEPPWPLTIGGLPLVLFVERTGRDTITPEQQHGNFQHHICDQDITDSEMSDHHLRSLATKVYKEFKTNLLNDLIVELIFTFERRIYIVFDDQVDIPSLSFSLPRLIACCRVGYINNRDLHRPPWAESPTLSVTADMRHPINLGILFKNSTGKIVKVSRLANSDDVFRVIPCRLRNPNTNDNDMEGSVYGKSVRFDTSTSKDEPRCVVYTWYYMGQTEGRSRASVRPSHRDYGCMIWDDVGLVTGYYRYYIEEGPWSGFMVSNSSSEIIELERGTSQALQEL